MNDAATIVLAVLAIMIPILGLLVAALYSNIKETYKELKIEVERHKVAYEKRIDEVIKEARVAICDADIAHEKLWEELNNSKEKYHDIDIHNKTLCQKHDGHFNRIDEHIVTLESKIKGDGMFFNQRFKEFDHDIQFIQNRIVKLEINKEL